MDFNEAIKLKIRVLLKEKRWSIPELARRASMNKQTLYNNLDTDIEVKLATLVKISKAFGLKSMDFWFAENETNILYDQNQQYGNNDNTVIEHLRREINDLRDHLATKEILIQRLLKEQSQPSHQGK